MQTPEKCLEMFRLNPLDIEIDPSLYGTHSFRRGGCQVLLICAEMESTTHM